MVSISCFRWREKERRNNIVPRKYRKQAGRCSKIVDIHGVGQCKCEILGVKAVLSLQKAKLTVMIVSHFR